MRMGLLDIFKLQSKQTASIVRQAGATLYPDKIVIQTVDRIKDLYSITSTNVTILGLKASSEFLGQTLRYHLEQSRDNIKKPKDIGDDRYAKFLKAAGFKNRKEHHRNALHLVIGEKDGKIDLSPMINRGPTGKKGGFYNTQHQPLVVDVKVSDTELGDALRLGWTKCVSNYP
jgi:hypothetical protein